MLRAMIKYLGMHGKRHIAAEQRIIDFLAQNNI